MKVERCNYLIDTNSKKENGQYLTSNDMLNIGYMAGRFGINLDGKINENNIPKETENGLLININSCTKDLFEDNLKKSGIKFDVIV